MEKSNAGKRAIEQENKLLDSYALLDNPGSKLSFILRVELASGCLPRAGLAQNICTHFASSSKAVLQRRRCPFHYQLFTTSEKARAQACRCRQLTLS